MKTLKVYERKVSEKSGKYFNKVAQVIIQYGEVEFRNGHYEDLDNPRLRNKFDLKLNTRSKKTIEEYVDRLSKHLECDKYKREVINKILESEGK